MALSAPGETKSSRTTRCSLPHSETSARYHDMFAGRSLFWTGCQARIKIWCPSSIGLRCFRANQMPWGGEAVRSFKVEDVQAFTGCRGVQGHGSRQAAHVFGPSRNTASEFVSRDFSFCMYVTHGLLVRFGVGLLRPLSPCDAQRPPMRRPMLNACSVFRRIS